MNPIANAERRPSDGTHRVDHDARRRFDVAALGARGLALENRMPDSPSTPAASETALRDGGRLLLIERWLSDDEHAALFAQLREETPWRQESVLIARRRVRQPRLTAWVGDPHARYTYSGLANAPLPWSETLSQLRRRVEETAAAPFNSVLLNFYRDGDDAMGMHSDQERELGENPRIASLSLGATRRFVLQHRRDKSERRVLELRGGSLLLMLGSTQHHYKHGVPRQHGAGPRLNLTFRLVLT